MRLSEADYYNSTPQYLTLAISGKREFEQTQVEIQYDIARTMSYFMVQPHSKKTINPKKIWPLPWDKVENIAELIKSRKHIFDKLTPSEPRDSHKN
ncbi:hypothetical protein [Yeosuana sp.]|uniref:hypothetical protein n=1 Tax=Yeosuana sp. TaxID=2529388 RepID=UPI004054CD65